MNNKRIAGTPVTLDRLEVVRLLNRILNPKPKLLMALAYGAGLRLSEIINLKARDVDLKNSVITLKCSAKKYERITILPQRLKNPLWNLIKNKKSDDYVFQNQSGAPFSPRTVQDIFERAAKKAEIQKPAMFHSLRHSFAAHLWENGIDLKCIQKLLGHKNIRTTRIYAKSAAREPQKIQSPLEHSGFLIFNRN